MITTAACTVECRLQCKQICVNCNAQEIATITQPWSDFSLETTKDIKERSSATIYMKCSVVKINMNSGLNTAVHIDFDHLARII